MTQEARWEVFVAHNPSMVELHSVVDSSTGDLICHLYYKRLQKDGPNLLVPLINAKEHATLISQAPETARERDELKLSNEGLREEKAELIKALRVAEHGDASKLCMYEVDGSMT